MSDSHVTQCPHCRTSFRVSQAQLSAAQGAVRCGACLHVFNAAQQIFGSARPQPPKKATEATSAPAHSATPASTTPANATATADTLWIHDDLDLDSLDLDGELERILELEQQGPAPAKPEFQPARRREEPRADTLNAQREEPLFEFISEAPLAAEPGFDVPEQRSQNLKPEATHSPKEPTFGVLSNDYGNPSIADNEPDLGREPLFRLDDEPLQLDWQSKPRTNWARAIGWSLLNLVALGALLGQYINYNFDALARQEHARPWFELACPVLGCQLPEKVDISQIRSSNLVVRSHPQFSSALVVDAILYNRAPFAQPFPLLEIRFADIAGQLIASRRFKPSEYLAGELAGQTLMPPQTPIHIALDILDPGPRAMNYSLSFHSPQ